jgi:hypothetical protein
LIAFVKDRLRGRCAGAGACVVGDVVVVDVGERASSEMAALSGITEVAARASLPVKVGWSMAMVVIPVGEDSGVDMADALAIRQAVPSLWVWGFREGCRARYARVLVRAAVCKKTGRIGC